MKDYKTLDGALCADGQTGEDAVSAAGKKKYVPPRMEVIPLGCGLLVASSPVDVIIKGGFSYYGGAACTESDVCSFMNTIQNSISGSCYLKGFTGPGITFGANAPSEWTEAGFLAGVQFEGGCSFELLYKNMPYWVNGTYNGHQVRVKLDYSITKRDSQ